VTLPTLPEQLPHAGKPDAALGGYDPPSEQPSEGVKAKGALQTYINGREQKQRLRRSIN
jgi:hypothetical protein